MAQPPCTIEKVVGSMDIYLIDQIMKGRYASGATVLDAGCGTGRNLFWFLQNDIKMYGVDKDVNALSRLWQLNQLFSEERFRQASVEHLPFADNFFDHIVSSAVLHFAESTSQFLQMMAEMVRVLRPGGSLFIRMTSDIGIEDKVKPLGDGVYHIPDGSRRFLLTRSLLAEVMQKNRLAFLEPLKTSNVEDIRCMSTLVLAKC
jgi:tellurite methyltransferase